MGSSLCGYSPDWTDPIGSLRTAASQHPVGFPGIARSGVVSQTLFVPAAKTVHGRTNSAVSDRCTSAYEPARFALAWIRELGKDDRRNFSCIPASTKKAAG